MSVATPADASGPVLRDIHLPPAPSWWPPAPGWWLLAVLGALALFFAARWLLRLRRERRWRAQVLAELERIAARDPTAADDARLAAEVSELLRRASRWLEPSAVALRGEQWLDFLDAQLPPERKAQAPFRTGPGRALIDAPFQRATTASLDRRALLELARHWLGAILARGRRRV